MERAKLDRDNQYAAMKSRIQYYYENGDESLVVALLESKNLDSFLNKADEMEELTKYDRESLQDLEQTVQTISDQEAALENEQQELTELKQNQQDTFNQVQTVASEVDGKIQEYTANISAEQMNASNLQAQIDEQKNKVASLTAQAQAEQEAREQQAQAEAQAEALAAQQQAQADADAQAQAAQAQADTANAQAAQAQSDADAQAQAAADAQAQAQASGDAAAAAQAAAQAQAAAEAQAEAQRQAEAAAQAQAAQQAAAQAAAEAAAQAEAQRQAELAAQQQAAAEAAAQQAAAQAQAEAEQQAAAQAAAAQAAAAQQSQGTYLGKFKITAYCGCAICCGTAGKATASGVMPTAGHTIAMAGVPFGTKLRINGVVYTVEDRGTPYGHVDIFMNSHSEALQFGLQYADVYQVN